MKRRTLLVFFRQALLVILGSAQILGAKDWNQWRGPDRDGTAREFAAPAVWPDSLQLVWRVSVGAGLSSPVMLDDRIFLLTRRGEQEVASCLDVNSGAVVWKQSYAAPFIPNPQAIIPRFFPESRGLGPFATPLVHAGRVYTLGIDRVFSIYDTRTGQQKWQHQYRKQEVPAKVQYECPPCGCSVDGEVFDQPGECPDCNMTYGVKGVDTSAQLGGPNYYGAACSPLLLDGRVLLHVGDAEKGHLLALDAETGHDVWVWDSPPMSSSSPVATTLHGVRQVIVLSRTSVAGVAAADGQLLWSFPLESNAQVVTPIVFEDLVIFSAYRSPTKAIRVSKNPSGWSVDEAWQNPDVTLYTSTPILNGHLLFGLSYAKRGQFFCLDVRTGETLWLSEGRQAQGAAILNLGDTFIALTDEGKLKIIEKNVAAFQLQREYAVADSPTWAHPVLWDKNILIKDEMNLTLWRLE